MTEIINPIWLQILSKEGLANFELKNGPTIPFLVGVYHHFNKLSDHELDSKDCIRKIFAEILTDTQTNVSISVCPQLGVHIIHNASVNILTLDNQESWAETLWSNYGKYIKARKFSIDTDDYSWREFDKNDFNHIATIK